MADCGIEPLPDAGAAADADADAEDPDFTSISRRCFEIVTDNREQMQAQSGEREEEK